jgi:3-methylfumaryl-CoA hydratase
MDKLNLEAWTGRLSHEAGGLDSLMAQRVHATLGQGGAAPQSGDFLPPLWHWCAFAPVAPLSELGPDGHPRSSDFLPPVALPRRMWAGGHLRFVAPLRVDDPLTRVTSLRSVTEKETAAGTMVLMTLDHAIRGPQGLAIEERQDIVYLDIPDTYTPPKKRAVPAPVAHQTEMSAAQLFRYSAVTFNAHRIHYDRDYARDVEHYPDLVVHGPLQASLLMQAATGHKGRPPQMFSFRSVHPMFAGTPLDIAMAEEDGALNLWTGQAGHQGMQATAIWEETQ